MKEHRENGRSALRFEVLEHPPKGGDTRKLVCLDYSRDGMRLKGQARYDRFTMTVSTANDGRSLRTEVHVTRKTADSFAVKFINPDLEVTGALAWLPPEAA